jgi:hypothetical protein
MNEDTTGRSQVFKWVVGLIPLLASVLIMGLLFFVAVPAGNKDTLLPLAGVFFGWGGAVVSYEFGSSPAGRLAAKNGIKDAKP